MSSKEKHHQQQPKKKQLSSCVVANVARALVNIYSVVSAVVQHWLNVSKGIDSF